MQQPGESGDLQGACRTSRARPCSGLLGVRGPNVVFVSSPWESWESWEGEQRISQKWAEKGRNGPGDRKHGWCSQGDRGGTWKFIHSVSLVSLVLLLPSIEALLSPGEDLLQPNFTWEMLP